MKHCFSLFALIRHFSLYVLSLALLLPISVLAALAESTGPHPILLAEVYRGGIDVSAYWVSEKLDGVRAIWDGKQLHTRAGNLINAPAWFTQKFPQTAMDGELWSGRGQFETTSGIVRKAHPIDSEWRNIQYRVFELPNASGSFTSRYQKIVALTQQLHLPHLKAVPQFRVQNTQTLATTLASIVKNGGEGLMLHLADAPYITGRSQVLLKLKPYFDAEATVVGYTAGRRKYQGKVGALIVETPEGMRFKLGTGLSDAERTEPPKLGSIVTYTYRDVTKAGKPKFASFLRIRDEK